MQTSTGIIHSDCYDEAVDYVKLGADPEHVTKKTRKFVERARKRRDDSQ